MNVQRFYSETLVKLLHKRKIATLGQMKDALGTQVDVTVFRKLTEVSYLTSYSHRGGYYTLSSIPDFSEIGLWTFRSIHFSRYGKLVNTVEALIEYSEQGYFANELKAVLKVEVKETLLKLVQEKRVSRKKFDGRYFYCSTKTALKNRQVLSRRTAVKEEDWPRIEISEEVPLTDEMKGAVVLFFSLLDEQQRRLYVGLESLRLGRGGDMLMADFFGLDYKTVAKGRHQLLTGDLQIDHVRKPGAGRKSVKKIPESDSND